MILSYKTLKKFLTKNKLVKNFSYRNLHSSSYDVTTDQYILKFKEGLITNNAAITSQANALYQLWTKQCDQARITYINQNDMNQILEIANSWDRPRYNKSTKIIK